MGDGTTPRPWQVYADENNVGTDAPKYATKEAVMIYADEDCESHPIADCSANHTCRPDWECAANAAFIVRAVNSYDALVAALNSAERRARRDGLLDYADQYRAALAKIQSDE